MILGKNLVSKYDANWTLERFAWLIKNFSPTYGPLRASLCCIEGGMMEVEHYPIAAYPEAWAKACFESIKYRAGMGRWPIEFVGLEKDRPRRASDKELPAFGQRQPSLERYYTDAYGRPVIYYEPSRITEPGYITARAARSLAALIHLSASAPEQLQQDNPETINTVTAAFLGLGLPLAYSEEARKSREEGVVIDAFHRIPGAHAIFASAVFLSLKGCDGARAERLYSGLIDDLDLERLQEAFAQLRHFNNDITRLRAQIMGAEQDLFAVPDDGELAAGHVDNIALAVKL